MAAQLIAGAALALLVLAVRVAGSDLPPDHLQVHHAVRRELKSQYAAESSNQLQGRTAHLGQPQLGPARRPQLLQFNHTDLTLDPFIFLNEAPDNVNETCDYFFQSTVLKRLYTTNGGPNWIRNDLWLNDSYVCQKVALNGSVYIAPSYCCWFGVDCCIDQSCGTGLQRYTCNCNYPGVVTSLNLPRNKLNGPLASNLLSWLSCELKYVDLAFNNLVGTINSSISKLTNLNTLSLGNNNFIGSLPGELRLLTQLQVLDVTNNDLTGVIPSDLCNNDGVTNLADLLLASNWFNESYDIPQCENLVALDLTRNELTGKLPTFEGYHMLHIARMGGNHFTGTMPATISGAALLTDLDLSFNQLTGVVPETIGNLRLLAWIRLNSNQNLTGTIPPSVFANLGTLGRLNLADNFLTGTIPEIEVDLGTLLAMDLSNNSLVGSIPDTFSVFARPNIGVDLALNLLSCCGLNPLTGPSLRTINDTADAYGGVNWALAGNFKYYLPSYLAFSDYLVPQTRNRAGQSTYMRCPDIIIANTTDSQDSSLQWDIDPSYYLWHNCQCDSGWEMKNKTQPGKLPIFVCEPIEMPWYVKSPWVLALIVVGATLIVLAVLFLTCYRKGARPAFMQQYFNMRKRLQGEPKDGIITVVTTDIEGYSDLMKREPELMGKGLRIHNYCIDKARWQFFGYTMEQEGDSFIIAFCDPFDAVAFCLQAQLLLQHVEWPDKLLNAEGGSERVRKGSILTQAGRGLARILMRDNTNKSQTYQDSPTGAGPSKLSGSSSVNNPMEEQPSTGLGIFSSLRSGFRGSSFKRKTNPGAIPEDQPVVSQNELQADMASRLSLDPARSSRASLGPNGGSMHSCSQLSNEAPTSTGSMPQQDTSNTTGIRFLSTMPGMQSRSAVFNGLRVRMGIATGKLEKGTSLRSSNIMERSKVVSDAAAGGQVLLDGTTFLDVKARLVELGAVDHNGLSLSKMNLSRPTMLAYMCGSRSGNTDETEMALVLDMGQYVHSSTRLGSIINTTQNAHNVLHQTQDIRASSFSESNKNNAAIEQAATAAVAAVDGHLAGNVDASAKRLHLYQVVSPTLVERAHHFGSHLALKQDDWICVDADYFSAPGAAAAALGLDASSTIPAITMVFCMIDGAKDWKQLNDKGRRSHLQRIMRDVLVNTLISVKGGYMCRLQEDEFKYMVAFPTPEDAVKWCLIIQDALMWQEWPDWLLKQEKAREERDERGHIAFRGPRLRMGMCHGQPRAIVPDHMGRADYHGASINSAARYMDAAAHGGQVVCEEDTAMAMFTVWNGNAINISLTESGQAAAARTAAAAAAGTAGDGTPAAGAQTDITWGEIAPSPFNIVAMRPQADGWDSSGGSATGPPTPSASRPASTGPAGGLMLQPLASGPTPHSTASFPGVPMGGADRRAALAAERDGTTRSASAVGAADPLAGGAGGSSGSAALGKSGDSSFKLEGEESSGKLGVPLVQDGASSSKLEGETTQAGSVAVGGASEASGAASPVGGASEANGRSGAASQAGHVTRSNGSGSVQIDLAPSRLAVSSTPTSSNGASAVVTPGGGVTLDPSSAGPYTSTGSRLRTSSAGQMSPHRPTSPLAISSTAATRPPLGHHPLDTIHSQKERVHSDDIGANSGWPVQSSPSGGAVQGSSSAAAAASTALTATVATQGILKGGSARFAARGSGDGSGSDGWPGGSGRVGGGSGNTNNNRQGAGVRIQLPAGSGPALNLDNQSSQEVGGSERGRSVMTTGSMRGLSTYFTSISAFRIGSFMFKGSPEEIPMVNLLLENHTGRSFPSDPPKGKGGRTLVSSGLAAMAPEVELPIIARRYFWAWRAAHRDELAGVTGGTITPRGHNNIKGWAVNILMTSRSQSHIVHSQHRSSGDHTGMGGARALERRSGAGTGAGGSVGGTSGGTRPTFSGAMNRSKNQLMALVRVGSRLSPRMPSSPRTNSEGGGAGSALHSQAGSASANDPLASSQQGHHRTQPSDPARSDSISSFIAAAEENMLQQQQQEEEDQREQRGGKGGSQAGSAADRRQATGPELV